MSLSLKDLAPGQRGRIVRLDRRGALGQRMADMGLIAGAVVEVKRIAPLGDPLEVQIRGYRLSLRKAEAAGILVERIEA
ncbi:MAG: ferrous iron transport protein A [Verrucomicrobia bacterium]|nr:ferrous iron transport protein A [Verrucomicrobiota bacterium]